MLQEREEAAAAQQLLQLQATSPMADLEPVFLTSFGSLRFPLTLDEDKQTQHQKSPPKVQLSKEQRQVFSSISHYARAPDFVRGTLAYATADWLQSLARL